MQGLISLPENFKIVSGTAGPVTTNGGVTCDYVSLKNANRAWIIVHSNPAGGAHATTVQPQKATAVAPTGAVSVTSTYRAWENADISATDTLVAVTAATSQAFANTTADQLMVIEIDCSAADWTAGSYDVLGCTLSDSSQASNYADVLYILDTKVKQATPPAAITD